jgi:dTDP-4-dehydrorhamnose reductase
VPPRLGRRAGERSLILGGGGMLGRALAAEARARGWAALALPRQQVDIRDRDAVRFWLAAFRPEVVINSAAFTKVDLCEGEAREEAMAVNGAAVAGLVAETTAAGARLVQISSDYVFDGNAGAPYREDAPTAPLSAYGESKLAGERHALAAASSLVVRSSWLFGPGGPNFAATIVRLIEAGKHPLRVVDDQVGAPTYTPFLARAVLDLVASGERGLVHYRNDPPASWYAFAVGIARGWPAETGTVEVLPVKTAEMPRPALRPAYSVLNVECCERLLGRPVEPWLAGLTAYLDGMRNGRIR